MDLLTLIINGLSIGGRRMGEYGFYGAKKRRALISPSRLFVAKGVCQLFLGAFDDNTLVFVEVKTAGKQRNFSPADNLSANQKKRNYNAAKVYMRSLDNCPYPGKFDLVEVFFRWNFIVKIRRTANYLPDLPVQSSYE